MQLGELLPNRANVFSQFAFRLGLLWLLDLSKGLSELKMNHVIMGVLLGGPTPMSEWNGTPVKDIPDAVLIVPPAKSAHATTRIIDILEPNYTHEYTFDGAEGEQVAISVQFISVSARAVRRNVAILSPSGQNEAEYCQREGVSDSSSISYECSLTEAGTWRLLVFGRANESVGLYFASVQKLGF